MLQYQITYIILLRVQHHRYTQPTRNTTQSHIQLSVSEGITLEYQPYVSERLALCFVNAQAVRDYYGILSSRYSKWQTGCFRSNSEHVFHDYLDAACSATVHDSKLQKTLPNLQSLQHLSLQRAVTTEHLHPAKGSGVCIQHVNLSKCRRTTRGRRQAANPVTRLTAQHEHTIRQAGSSMPHRCHCQRHVVQSDILPNVRGQND